jgi:hypothetical protein
VRQGRPQVELLGERLLPSSAPILTGDTFYLNNSTATPDRLTIVSEDATPGLSARSFVGTYQDTAHGFVDQVSGKITATGAVTPGVDGVPISTISFSGSGIPSGSGIRRLAYPRESLSFTGQVFGSGYDPRMSQNCQSNSIDGTLAESVSYLRYRFGGGFYWSASTWSAFTSGSDWYQCIV